MKLYIDDLRTPPYIAEPEWMLVRSSNAAIDWMVSHGCPEYISFDHDLSGDDTTMPVVNWMIEKDMNENCGFIPPNFMYLVHSANPVGAKNIQEKLDNYLAFRQKEGV